MPTSGPGLGQLFDGYSRRARVAPAFITALPVTLLCVVLVPSLANWNRLWLLAVAGGTLILIDQLVRDKGRAIQPALWHSWGGPPATQALRHNGSTNSILLARQHGKLASLLGVPMPSRRQESRNPQKADEAYETAVRYLISRTRDTNIFRLVYLENCHYGFRRNMLGMRKIGLTVSVTVFLGTAGAAIASFYALVVWKVGFVLVSVVSLFLSAFWWKAVNSRWVESAAKCYADRLLESLDVLLPIDSEQPQGEDPPNGEAPVS